MNKIIIAVFGLCVIVGGWFVFSELYTAEAQKAESVVFSIDTGESVSDVAIRLEEQQIVRHAWLFKKYLVFKGIDKDIRAGEFKVTAPITLKRVVEALAEPSVGEVTITVIPGWGLREVANYFEENNIVSTTEFLKVTGQPAERPTKVGYKFKDKIDILTTKPEGVSLEGYLRPDTYRIFKNATAEEIVTKLITSRENQFDRGMIEAFQASGRDLHEVMTVASIVEREVRGERDRAKVADIFWRRYDLNWALQADSTVHYAVGKTGELFSTAEDRKSLSPWNTYQYPGLPPSPISAPSIESIMATIYPEPNDDWYFLTDLEGGVHYAESLEEHNENVQKYIR